MPSTQVLIGAIISGRNDVVLNIELLNVQLAIYMCCLDKLILSDHYQSSRPLPGIQAHEP